MGDRNRLKNLRSALKIRDQVHRSIRGFFHARNFIEVTTPIRVATPAMEEHIDAEPSGDHYLRTSPELHMKRLLAAGYRRLFQIGPCFRQGERGRLHRPEYTMLEWYRADAHYSDILLDAKTLLLHVAKEVLGSTELSYNGQHIDLSIWERIPISDAFLQYAGWDPLKDYDANRFDLDLVEKVEPGLPKDMPVVLTDYPAEAAALARLNKEDSRIAERWELYIGGLELANAYSELVDAREQRARFENCATQREKHGKPIYPLDEPFLEALEDGMPNAGGIALGIDRLIMLLTDSGSIDDVIPFEN